MADLGTYYIQIMPSAKGIGNNIEKELNNEMGDAGKKAGGVFSGGFSKVLATGGKIALAASAAVATGIGIITKQAVSNYAEYEQLVGGIEKLYGDASETVKQYANDAFKTVGMSANQYMASTTAFSAKLLNDFGGDSEKAAEYANKAMMQIADNANTFGKFSVDELTQVYQALARGSYMTLDNLNLGFSGTKEGMQQLLDKAEELTGVKYDINNFNDVIDAIGAVQDSLNITGTTANEALGTISGSLNMTKAAWDNLLTGIANPDADLGQLIGDLVTSASAAIQNLLPIVQQALLGITDAIGVILPQIINMLPGLLQEWIPAALSALEAVAMALLGALPILLDVAMQAILTIANGLTEALPTLVPFVVDIVLQIADTLMSNLGDLLIAATEIIVALANGIVNSLPTLLTKAPEIIQKLTDALIKAGPQLNSATVEIMNVLTSGIIQNLPQLLTAAIQIITTLVNGIMQNLPVLVSAAGRCIQSFQSSFGSINWASLGTAIINGIVNGISSAAGSIASAARSAAQNALNSAKSLLGIHSPSRVFRDQVGAMIGKGMAEGISDSENAVNRAMAELSNGTLGRAQIAVSTNSRMTSSPSYGEAMQAQLAGVGNITIPVYIGQQKFAQAVVNAQNVMNYRSGGR